jgi:hypothetical protein
MDLLLDNEEKWKAIPDCFPYEVSDQGRIRNSSSGLIRKLSQKAEYIQVRLLVNKKGVYRSVHKLVAEQFLPPPTDKRKKLVNHKNGNKKDNRAENLEWVSQSENKLHAIHVLGKNKGCERAVIQCDLEDKEIQTFNSLIKAADELKLESRRIGLACRESDEYGGFKWRYAEEKEAEIDLADWKPVPYNDNYLMSKSGQIYSKFSRKLMKIQRAESGYECVCISGGEKVVRKYIHILMAETFLNKPEGTVVNHKDGNKANNHLDNLECVSQSKNILEAVKAGKIAKRVVQCNPKTHESIREYSSIVEAARDHEISHSRISSVLTGEQKTAAKFFWKYA